MRWKILTLNLFFLLSFISGNLHAQEEATAKETKKTSEAPAAQCRAKEKVSISAVSEQMAEIWCNKLTQCSPNAEMSPKECRRVLKKSFQEGFQKTPSGQKVEVDEAGLCQCSESIMQDTCDALRKAQSLPGCDFIRLLNRS